MCTYTCAQVHVHAPVLCAHQCCVHVPTCTRVYIRVCVSLCLCVRVLLPGTIPAPAPYSSSTSSSAAYHPRARPSPLPAERPGPGTALSRRQPPSGAPGLTPAPHPGRGEQGRLPARYLSARRSRHVPTSVMMTLRSSRAPAAPQQPPPAPPGRRPRAHVRGVAWRKGTKTAEAPSSGLRCGGKGAE